MAEQSRLQLVAWGLVALLLVAAGLKVMRRHTEAPPAAPVRVERPVGREAPGQQAAGQGQAYVHVVGAVRRPGVYRVPRSARVAAALERAGGATRRADLAAVNLAARLVDGQQVVVPRAGARPGMPVAGAATGSSGAGGAPVSLATATAEQLDALDGIGPTLAKRIVEYRDAHGGFRSVSELGQVDGIGEKRLAALRGALSP